MTQYIDKDRVVAEIRKLIRENELYLSENTSDAVRFQKTGAYSVLNDLLHFIDTLEVKEANFDNDLFEEVYSHLDSIKDTADRMTSGNFMHNKAAIKFSANTITKVLELIGLKAQKGG